MQERARFAITNRRHAHIESRTGHQKYYELDLTAVSFATEISSSYQGCTKISRTSQKISLKERDCRRKICAYAA